MPRTALLALALVVALLAAIPAGPAAADGEVVITTLGNRADLISAGDAYVEVVLPAGVDAADVAVDVDGRDVTADFAVRADGRFTGRVSGLVDGPNAVRALLPDGSGAVLTVTSHPAGGSIFSGPQIQPWLCTTEANGLGAPLDAQCTGTTLIQFFYMAAGGDAFEP